jgi:Na+/proline symporter
MKAVVWADVFQASVVLVGMLAVMIRVSSVLAGGFGNVMEVCKEAGRLGKAR